MSAVIMQQNREIKSEKVKKFKYVTSILRI